MVAQLSNHRTEYGISINDKIVSVDASGSVPLVFHDHGEAVAFANELRESDPAADVRLQHRRVVEGPWALTC